MLLDVSKVLKNFGESMEVSGEATLPEVKKMGAEPVFSKLTFSGKLTNIGGVLQLSLKARGSYDVLCSRCAKNISNEFEKEFTELLVNEETAGEKDDDAVVFSGHEVNISDIVLANVFLSLPSVFLCKEDCKGLCPKCGTDLNESNCSCADDEIDPRWEALKNFVIRDSE